MKLTFGFSPCPNDTFMMDALVNNRLSSGDLEFVSVIDDVEELNKRAMVGDLDITKLSFHTFAQLTASYQLLKSGSALGRNCGPLLISLKSYTTRDFDKLVVAIPGINTTASFLFGLAIPKAAKVIEMPYSEIEDAIINGKVDAGVIIHENRFTYQLKGLKKVLDLGSFWESKTGLPIPLGGIAIKRSLPQNVKNAANDLIRQSVQFAIDNPGKSMSFIRQHAQEMDENVCRRHIDLYVNQYSLDLGPGGTEAVRFLVSEVTGAKNLKISVPIFAQ